MLLATVHSPSLSLPGDQAQSRQGTEQSQLAPDPAEQPPGNLLTYASWGGSQGSSEGAPP